MSCQIRLTATIADIGAIRRCLFPTDDSRGSDSWLQLCEISVSPTGDIIAIGNERRLVILSSRWDKDSSLSQFQIIFSGSIHDSDNIKAVLCLPIVSYTKSSDVVPDWSCVMVGFDSGFVRFYTENCELLLQEQLHSEVISSIKCQSQHNPRPDIAPELHPEEIYIQYQSNVCVVAGTHLFSILRTCRTDLAKVQAKGGSYEMSQENIIPKKWGFQDQATVNDVAVVGVNLHGTFDHLLTASTCGGFETKYQTSAPYNNLVLAAGSRPFIGYHYAMEGGPQPVFSDVAKAVATKLKSALPGWLTGNTSSVEKQMTVAMQPADTMGCRFGLCDLKRTAISIILSADRKLAAVSDAFGRILLLDAYRGITLKIFKGYRDAQCSFIQVPDERLSKHKIGNRVALFLVIYSPKKSTVEIFTIQQGAKIATFSASKYSKLIYNNYGLMGFTTTSKSRFVCQFTTVLIDNDGQIKEISIPFHFALSEKNNKRAKDIHLYKKLKHLLKYEERIEGLSTECCNICEEIKTLEIKTQTLDLILATKKVIPTDVVLDCVLKLSENLESEHQSEVDNLKIVLSNATLILNLYKFALDKSLDEENGNFSQVVETKLKLESKELASLQKFVDLSTISDEETRTEIRVGFADSSRDCTISDFVSVFDLKKPDVIELKPNLDESLIFKISELLFGEYIVALKSCTNLENFENEIIRSRISTKSLFVLLISYWEHRSLGINSELEREMNNLLSLITILIKTTDQDDLVSDYNSTSEFWSEIREILANSAKPFPALTAAILCKIVYLRIEQEREFNDSNSFDDNIEVLSQENIEWGLLIGKLEDVSLLNIVLSTCPPVKDSTLPKLKHEKTEISLRYVLNKGRGSVSELVARWLTTGGINPEIIVINEILSKKSPEIESSSDDNNDDLAPEQDILPHVIEKVNSEPILERLNLIRAQFPHSLDASYILANMTWEYALAWQKDIQNLDQLEACIKCLNLVPTSQIKEGLYNLVWIAHLRIIFESTCKLINKVGRLPKERLCKQDTGLSDYHIAIFLSICTDFLDNYMDAVQQSHELPKPTLNFEAIWENGPQPLVELALQQNAINYDMLHLHYQLSLTLQMITTFSMKVTKPVQNLFESYMLGLFFGDFHNQAQINWNYADSRVQNARTQFLFKVISVSLESVTVSDDGKVYTLEHVKWMSKCVHIARLWNLDVDLFRRYQVVQVFTNGFDSFGDEIFSCVEEPKKFGGELLAVAGRRMAHFLATSPNLPQNVSALTTDVTRYMEVFNGDWCAPSTLKNIENLTILSLSCMDKFEYEYKVGEMLLDGCRTLQDIYKSNE